MQICYLYSLFTSLQFMLHIFYTMIMSTNLIESNKILEKQNKAFRLLFPMKLFIFHVMLFSFVLLFSVIFKVTTNKRNYLDLNFFLGTNEKRKIMKKKRIHVAYRKSNMFYSIFFFPITVHHRGREKKCLFWGLIRSLSESLGVKWREMNKILSFQKRIIFHSVWTW